MAKYILEDMVREKRQRQSAKPTVKIGAKIEKPTKKENPISPRVTTPIEPPAPKTYIPKSRSRFMLWLVALVSVAFCFFALSVFFGKAEISVNPKVKEIVLNENLSATKDSNDALSFNLIAIDGVESKTIQATAQKDVSEKSTGTVILFNGFSGSVQSLNIDTRLEGSNGKIYKTAAKVTIPGMQKDGTPGSIEVGIYGSEAGDAYNSGPLDFKIFGFKGTPKYAKFYGRSKPGTSIKGGFVGKAPVVSDTERSQAATDMKATLQSKLLKKGTDQIPADFILFKDAIFLNTDDSNISSVYNKDNSLTVSLKGTLYGILLNEQKLTKKIATDTIPKYDGSDIFIPKIQDLNFSLISKDSVSLADAKSISFSLSGSAKIVWKVNLDKFTGALLGKSKNDFHQILTQYPNIDSANLSLTPFWKQSIPDAVKKVKITVSYPS